MDHAGMADGQWVVLAQVGRTHGIRGWLKLYSFTEPAQNISAYHRFTAEVEGETVELQIDQMQDQGNNLIVHFTGVDQPEQARKLVGVLLKVAKSALPALPAGEYYWHQLTGLRVVNRQGELLGRVQKLLETGANDVLVVVPCDGSVDGRERLIPYLRDKVVVGIDLEQDRIEVDWGADYLG